MSCTTCGSTTGCSCGCNPCNQVLSEEGLSSQISNLVNSLFGAFTKTVVNGRAVWTQQCSPNTSGLSCFPKGADEGFICYILRILDEIGLFSATVHDSGNSYCKNTMVASGTSLYVAIQDVPVGIAISDTAYWLLLITAPTGATGPQGAPGASGGGSATNFATQVAAVTVLLTNTGAVVFCEPSGAMAVNLPAIASVDPGKWYKIWTNGAFAVTVTPDGAETINGAGTFVMSTPNQAIEIVSDSISDWRIF